MEVGYLDESGFSLTLPPPTLLESEGGPGVPQAWGSHGRVNVVGHLVRGERGSGCTLPFWRGRCGGRWCGGTWTGWREV